MGCENEIVRWLLDLRVRFCPQSPRLDSRSIQDSHMGKLFQTENVMLTEEGYGLYLYFTNTTVEFHEGFEYDIAIPLGHISHDELEGIAHAILSWIAPNDSIE